MPTTIGFIAYPSNPDLIGITIESANKVFSQNQNDKIFETWKETFESGTFIDNNIREKINSATCLVADVTCANLNVIYEIGYAIGRRKRVLPIINKSFKNAGDFLKKIGILDMVGHEDYENEHDLSLILSNYENKNPLYQQEEKIYSQQPVYLLDCFRKTSYQSKLISSIKNAHLLYRSFDPREQSRLSTKDAIKNVSQSAGIIVPLLNDDIDDSHDHNMRGFFLIGLAHGMNKETLILQFNSGPISLDIRDFVTTVKTPDEIEPKVKEFQQRVFIAIQSSPSQAIASHKSFLAMINLGASAAENEYRDLKKYYVETFQFQRALRGEGRLVVGRKGSGKSAIFFQVRDQKRDLINAIVLDLKPESYQLRKFKEEVLSLMKEGAKEHTVTAFWEYLILLEICNKILEKDRRLLGRDAKTFEKYLELEKIYKQDEYIQEGDFSERMIKILSNIQQNYSALIENKKKNLNQEDITRILHIHDVKALSEKVIEYAKTKDFILILFDNLDKGWPPHGVDKDDILMIRTLLDATRKIERLMAKNEVDCKTLVFLRNDVYELLVENTSDRGKEGLISIDWTDPSLLRELILKRLIFSGAKKESDFYKVWSEICVPIIDDEESSTYLIERSLMRPRCLINLMEYCISHAVNMGNKKIELGDIKDGLYAYSLDLIRDIGYEIKDVFPVAQDVLYGFIVSKPCLKLRDIEAKIMETGIDSAVEVKVIIDFLLWFGFFGIRQDEAKVLYIYNCNYDMKLFTAKIKKEGIDSIDYCINPAFWPGLEIS